MVAQKRFELLSRAPEAPMLDHYTTGLQYSTETSYRVINFNAPPSNFHFCFFADNGFVLSKKLNSSAQLFFI